MAYFFCASSLGQCTHFARTNNGHLCLCQQPRAAHALRSDQNSGHLRLCQQSWAAHALRSDPDHAELVLAALGLNVYGCEVRLCNGHSVPYNDPLARAEVVGGDHYGCAPLVHYGMKMKKNRPMKFMKVIC